METTIVKLNPTEYGLKETEAQTIEKAFMPKIIERDALHGIYEKLITEELTPELCIEAKDLRLKLVKVRTGIAEIHRTQKAYFLAAGRYVDAWKNKETAPIEQMEEKCNAIEKYYENMERERKNKLRDERVAELSKYEMDGSLMLLGEMKDEVWVNFLAGAKFQFEQKKEAERKAEAERLAAIEAERQRQIERDVENERLKKAAEETARKAEYDRKLRAKRSEELRPYIIFIREYNTMISMPEKEYKKELADIKLAAQQHYAFEAKKKAEDEAAEAARKKAEAKMLADAKIAREKLEAVQREREKAEAELRAKKAAEEKAIKEAQEKALQEETARIKAEKAAVAAPDKEKILALRKVIYSIEKPKIKTPEAELITNNVFNLLNKVCSYIDENVNKL